MFRLRFVPDNTKIQFMRGRILGLLPEGARSDGEVLYKGRNLVGVSQRELRRLRGPVDPLV